MHAYALTFGRIYWEFAGSKCEAMVAGGAQYEVMAAAAAAAAAVAAATVGVEDMVGRVLPRKTRAAGRDWMVVQRFPRLRVVLGLPTEAARGA